MRRVEARTAHPDTTAINPHTTRDTHTPAAEPRHVTTLQHPHAAAPHAMSFTPPTPCHSCRCRCACVRLCVTVYTPMRVCTAAGTPGHRCVLQCRVCMCIHFHGQRGWRCCQWELQCSAFRVYMGVSLLCPCLCIAVSLTYARVCTCVVSYLHVRMHVCPCIHALMPLYIYCSLFSTCMYPSYLILHIQVSRHALIHTSI